MPIKLRVPLNGVTSGVQPAAFPRECFHSRQSRGIAILFDSRGATIRFVNECAINRDGIAVSACYRQAVVNFHDRTGNSRIRTILASGEERPIIGQTKNNLGIRSRFRFDMHFYNAQRGSAGSRDGSSCSMESEDV